MKNNKVAEIRKLVKDYGVKGFQTKVLKGIDLTILKNDFIAVMGPSGSGKTTLLNILSTIDKPTQGTVMLDGQDIAKMSNKALSGLRRDKIGFIFQEFLAIMGASGSGKTTLLNCISTIDTISAGRILLDGVSVADLPEGELAKFRRERLGFIFQEYNLLDTMTLQDNIALPLSLGGVSGRECIRRAQEFAEMFGLKEHLQKYPYQLSGGQKQRGAACRALITEPEIIFADEPTGALDSKAGRELLECLKRVHEDGQATILMVTHDPFCASYARDVYMLSDGQILCRISRGADRKEFYDRIIDVQTSMGGDFSWE